MAKAVTAKVKRKQIANYMESHFSEENFEVIEDLLDDDEPSIIIETETRVVTLWCDETGYVQENFEISPDGDKEKYTLLKKAYISLNTYILLNYKDAVILKDSFERSFIHLETKSHYVNLEYDFDSQEVRATEEEKKILAPKKPLNKDIDGQISLLDLNIGFDKETEVKPSVDKKVEPEKIIPKVEEKQYKRIAEGSIVTSKYSNKEYTVIEDFGNILKVKDKDRNSFQIPRADCNVE